MELPSERYDDVTGELAEVAGDELGARRRAKLA